MSGRRVRLVLVTLANQVVLFSGGVLFAADLLAHKYGLAAAIGAVALALAMLHGVLAYIKEKFIDAQNRMIETRFQSEICLAERSVENARDAAALREENRKLKDVALSALAVTMQMDNGFPLNLDPLKRDLAALEDWLRRETKTADGQEGQGVA